MEDQASHFITIQVDYMIQERSRQSCGLHCLILLCVLLFVGTLSAQRCEKSVSEIRYEFLALHYDNVVELASACLKRGRLSLAEQVQAYELLVLSYLELGRLEQAKSSLKSLLKLAPDFEIKPVEPNAEAYRIMAEARAEIAMQNGKSKWTWLVVGAGVVAGTVAAVMVINSDGAGDHGGFPKPPGRPQ